MHRYKDASPVDPSSTVGIFNDGTELRISTIRHEDIGDYTCIARNGEGQVSHTARVIIAGGAVIMVKNKFLLVCNTIFEKKRHTKNSFFWNENENVYTHHTHKETLTNQPSQLAFQTDKLKKFFQNKKKFNCVTRFPPVFVAFLFVTSFTFIFFFLLIVLFASFNARYFHLISFTVFSSVFVFLVNIHKMLSSRKSRKQLHLLIYTNDSVCVFCYMLTPSNGFQSKLFTMDFIFSFRLNGVRIHFNTKCKWNLLAALKRITNFRFTFFDFFKYNVFATIFFILLWVAQINN